MSSICPECRAPITPRDAVAGHMHSACRRAILGYAAYAGAGNAGASLHALPTDAQGWLRDHHPDAAALIEIGGASAPASEALGSHAPTGGTLLDTRCVSPRTPPVHLHRGAFSGRAKHGLKPSLTGL